MGEACRPWILDFVSHVFGSYDSEAGRRLIREYLLLVSKKNFKSGLAAGIMLTALIRNWRDAAEFLILAPTVEIANNSFYPARDMVRKDEELSDLFQVQPHTRTITHRTMHTTLKVVAADSETVGGKKGAGVLVDELWLFGKQANAENMFREALGGMASRPEGFTIFLSTQADEAPAGIWRQKLQYARAVRDGSVVDPQFLPVLYEFPPAMIEAKEYEKPENFYITNPNLGASVDVEFINREARKAAHEGPTSQCGFFAKHLNVEIGLALLSDRWAGAEYWQAQGTAGLTLEEVIRRSEVLVPGLDGGGLDDLFGMGVIGREIGTGRWLHWGHAWAHPSVMKRNKEEAARFEDFARDGDLTIVKRIGDDVDEIVALIEQCLESGKLNNVGVDPVGIGSVVDALTGSNDPDKQPLLDISRIVGISQGWKLSGAIKTLERRLADGTFIHGGSPMMAWSVSNARVEPRGNAVIITKQGSGSAKIDPLMATFNAVTLMALNPQANSLTAYMNFIGATATQ
jgi:phage terminase large subunit-like protein